MIKMCGPMCSCDNMSPKDEEIELIKSKLLTIERLKKEHHKKFEESYPGIQSDFHKKRYKRASSSFCKRQRVKIRKLMNRLKELGVTDFTIDKLERINKVKCANCRFCTYESEFEDVYDEVNLCDVPVHYEGFYCNDVMNYNLDHLNLWSDEEIQELHDCRYFKPNYEHNTTNSKKGSED